MKVRDLAVRACSYGSEKEIAPDAFTKATSSCRKPQSLGIVDGRALAQSQAVPVQIRHGDIRAAISACEKSQKVLVSCTVSMPWTMPLKAAG